VDGNILIADSEAIAEYLDEKYPIPEMLPKDVASKATTRELSRFHDTRFEPELRKLFGNVSPDKLDIRLNTIQAEEINIRLAQLSKMAEKLPIKLMLGHCGYPVTFAWLDILTPLLSLKINWPENVIKWRKHIEAFPAVSEELLDYRPKLKKWVNSL
jgi:glutathione S-transferase